MWILDNKLGMQRIYPAVRVEMVTKKCSLGLPEESSEYQELVSRTSSIIKQVIEDADALQEIFALVGQV